MSYIRPDEVTSPRSRCAGVIEVIHDPGRPNQMSVARIWWDDEERVACRWNGDDEHPKGNPLSRGQATWFVVDRYAEAFVEQAARAAAESAPNSLISQYREMANDAERERDAEEWSEGLIGDASSQR